MERIYKHLMKIKPEVHMNNPAVKFNRREQILISRARIGHSTITHKHIFEMEDPPICETFNIRIIIEHVLLHCQKYQLIRNNLNINLQLKEILNIQEQCTKIIKFLSEANLAYLLSILCKLSIYNNILYKIRLGVTLCIYMYFSERYIKIRFFYLRCNINQCTFIFNINYHKIKV